MIIGLFKIQVYVYKSIQFITMLKLFINNLFTVLNYDFNYYFRLQDLN